MAIKFHLFESKHTMARGHNIKISKHGDTFFSKCRHEFIGSENFIILDKFV